MAVAMIGPKFYAWDKNGKPLAFGKLYTYQARTNVPKATYQSEDAVVENTNPVILNGEGYANVYLKGSYKMVLKDDKENEIWSSDPVSANEVTEWKSCLSTTYLSSTTLKVSGNFVDTYASGSRVRIDNNTSEFSYSNVISSSYASDETTITIEDPVITTGVQEICVSVVSQNSLPERRISSVEVLKSLSLPSGVIVGRYYYEKGDDGYAEGKIKTEAERAADGDIIDGYINVTLANGNHWIYIPIMGTSVAEISAKQAGAKGDDTGNDKPPIQAAIDNYVGVNFPDGDYLITEPLTQTRRNILTGASRDSRILSRTSDIFNVGVSGGVSDQSVFQTLSLVSGVGAGHIFVQQADVIKFRFNNMYCEQQNDDKSIYTHVADLGNHIGNVWEGGKFIHTLTATEPAFKYIVSDFAGATNFNKWSNIELLRGSKPWFHFQSDRENNYIYDVFLENILCEITVKGIAVCHAINGFTVDGVTVYDLISGGVGNEVSEDMFTFLRGSNVTNQPSRNISIKNYRRLDADTALGVHVDFRFDSVSGASAQSVTFRDCSRNLAVDLLADLTNAHDIEIYSSRIDVSGTGYINLTRYETGGVRIEPEVLVLNGTVSNHILGTETGLLRCVPNGATRNLTGMADPDYTRKIFIYNADAVSNLVLVHEASSTAENRFSCPGLVNYTIPPYSGCTVIYSLDVNRWIIIDS